MLTLEGILKFWPHTTNKGQGFFFFVEKSDSGNYTLQTNTIYHSEREGEVHICALEPLGILNYLKEKIGERVHVPASRWRGQFLFYFYNFLNLSGYKRFLNSLGFTVFFKEIQK